MFESYKLEISDLSSIPFFNESLLIAFSNSTAFFCNAGAIPCANSYYIKLPGMIDIGT